MHRQNINIFDVLNYNIFYFPNERFPFILLTKMSFTTYLTGPSALQICPNQRFLTIKKSNDKTDILTNFNFIVIYVVKFKRNYVI